jgi:hypothetical protein
MAETERYFLPKQASKEGQNLPYFDASKSIQTPLTISLTSLNILSTSLSQSHEHNIDPLSKCSEESWSELYEM